MDAEVLCVYLHNINTEQNNVAKVSTSNIEGDIQDYIRSLLIDIFQNMNYRRYKLYDNSFEIYNLIHRSILSKEITDQSAEIIAEKYLNAETIGRDRYRRFGEGNEIKRGYLIQVLYRKEDSYYYFISKVELGSFLDEVSWNKSLGMPYGDKILKTCLFVFDDSFNLDDIYIIDKYNSKYWKNTFLQLQECNSNEDSTRSMFQLVKRKIKLATKFSPVDSLELENQASAYFGQPRKFSYDDMDKFIFSDYVPYKPDVINLNDLRDSIQSSIKTRQLDTDFEIAPQVLKNTLKRTLHINDYMELKLIGTPASLKTYIHSESRGRDKFIVIKVNDDTFNQFREE